MSSNDIALRVENLGKVYRLGRERPKASGVAEKVKQGLGAPFEWLVSQMRPPSEEETLWALKDVSFEIKRGEVVGFIGHNGAGKSTLLKILSRITEPTEGLAEIYGRIAALLEVGTGMHPELTGRENIYMNGTVLGMKKNEIDRKLDEIIDFSGIEKFLDTPVKRYSSGMRVRLGFAIAAHLEPEILVVDEVLAVGDANFQAKCLGRMSEVAKSGRTVLFVSHNMGAIRNLCSRAYLLHQGEVKFSGMTQAAIEEYEKFLEESSRDSLELSEQRSGSGEVRFVDFFVEQEGTGTKARQIFSGDNVTFVFVVQVKSDQVEQIDLGFSVHRGDGDPVTNLFSSFQGHYYSLASGRHEIRCTLRGLSLAPGRFRVRGRILVRGVESDRPKLDLGMVQIEMGNFYGTGVLGQHGYAPCLLRGEWK